MSIAGKSQHSFACTKTSHLQINEHIRNSAEGECTVHCVPHTWPIDALRFHWESVQKSCDDRAGSKREPHRGWMAAARRRHRKFSLCTILLVSKRDRRSHAGKHALTISVRRARLSLRLWSPLCGNYSGKPSLTQVY